MIVGQDFDSYIIYVERSLGPQIALCTLILSSQHVPVVDYMDKIHAKTREPEESNIFHTNDYSWKCNSCNQQRLALVSDCVNAQSTATLVDDVPAEQQPCIV
jgi:hypothetical protein